MDIDDIFKLLPHRYPFLFVDRVLEVEPGRRAVAIKNVSINEPYFVGHFPSYPVVPGVLLIEMVAQVGGLALRTGQAESDSPPHLGFLGHVRQFRFRQPARPGDTLRIEANVERSEMGVAVIRGQITCEGRKVADGEIVIASPPDSATQTRVAGGGSHA